MPLASTNNMATSLQELAESLAIVFPGPDEAWLVLVKQSHGHHGTGRLQVMDGRDRKISKGGEGGVAANISTE
jgi:hypothetical protein